VPSRQRPSSGHVRGSRPRRARREAGAASVAGAGWVGGSGSAAPWARRRRQGRCGRIRFAVRTSADVGVEAAVAAVAPGLGGSECRGARRPSLPSGGRWRAYLGPATGQTDTALRERERGHGDSGLDPASLIAQRVLAGRVPGPLTSAGRRRAGSDQALAADRRRGAATAVDQAIAYAMSDEE
jgi:hypothetical protein